MRSLRILAVACAVALALPTAASADTSVGTFDTGMIVSGSGVGMDVELSSPAADTLRVVDLDATDDLSAFGAECTEAPEDTVTCTGLTGDRFDAEVFGSAEPDAIAVDPAATFRTQLYGRDGDDVLLGGGADDRLGGGLGDDDVDGRGGSDLVDNGFDNSNMSTADDGSDIYRDTGASGQDSLNYGFQTVAVRMTVDDTANDGGAGGAEGDDIKLGFERLRGTPFNDVIVGGAAAETINGSGGDDDLDGGQGADVVEGNEGVDTLRMRDAAADATIDCDSASASSQGTGETAFVDAEDPEPSRCEVVDRLGGGTATPTPTATVTATVTTTATATVTPAGPGPQQPPGIVVLDVGTTETVARMPRLTGKKFDAARNQALREIAFADVDITFKRDCRNGQFLDVVKQSPLPGRSLPHSAAAPVAIDLAACIADGDYLRECNLESLRSDVKKVGGALDAEVANGVLAGLNRCKVDYDVKIAKAADEARIKLAAQLAEQEKERIEREKEDGVKRDADKLKADLRAAITCPVGGDLRIAVTDGYTPNKNFAGLRSDGSDAWTIPVGIRSAIELVVVDRGLQFPEATVFVDTDTVDLKQGITKNLKRQTEKGRTVFTIEPGRTGKIRVCAVQEAGGDQVLSAGVEIEVVDKPRVGSTYETVSGRELEITGSGAKGSASARPVAQAAFLGALWDAIVRAFSGTSRTITQQEASTAPKRAKTKATAQKARLGVGQISLDGSLVPKPAPVEVGSGQCLHVTATGAAAVLTCPVLIAPQGNALVGLSNDGAAILAGGTGGVVKANGQNTTPRASGTLIKPAGLVGQDGGSLVGPDGGTLVGPDGGTLVGPDGGTLIGPDGASVIARDGAGVTGALAGNAIAPAPAPLVGQDGGSLISNVASGLVAAGGLN